LPDRSSFRAIVADDDADYCVQIGDYLRTNGGAVVVANDHRELFAALSREQPDIILLDKHLGSVAAAKLLTELRGSTDVPIIIVTGRSDTVDLILHLELGADDEVSKTASPRELLARMKVALRRSRLPRAPASVCLSGERRLGGGWLLLVGQRVLRRPDGSACQLSSAEFAAMRMLTERVGAAVGRDALMRGVFERELRPGDRAVDTLVHKLRRKVGDPGEVIKSVRHHGYVFTGFDATHGVPPEG
jgi:two-component system phosphate regulon response regulator OmpR